MYNTEHFRRLVGIEIEALVDDINNLKKRVADLENELAVEKEFNNSKQEYMEFT